MPPPLILCSLFLKFLIMTRIWRIDFAYSPYLESHIIIGLILSMVLKLAAQATELRLPLLSLLTPTCPHHRMWRSFWCGKECAPGAPAFSLVCKQSTIRRRLPWNIQETSWLQAALLCSECTKKCDLWRFRMQKDAAVVGNTGLCKAQNKVSAGITHREAYNLRHDIPMGISCASTPEHNWLAGLIVRCILFVKTLLPLFRF